MARSAAEILESALHLPPEERADLAVRLIASLEEQQVQDADAAWAEEIERRITDLDSGTAMTRSWLEARRIILGLQG